MHNNHIHPIPITRLRSFWTQPLESLSAAVKLPIKIQTFRTQPQRHINGVVSNNIKYINFGLGGIKWPFWYDPVWQLVDANMTIEYDNANRTWYGIDAVYDMTCDRTCRELSKSQARSYGFVPHNRVCKLNGHPPWSRHTYQMELGYDNWCDNSMAGRSPKRVH